MIRAESEVPSHRWWHGRWFVRTMGAYSQGLFNAESGQPIFVVQRKLWYCRLCRAMVYSGTPIREHLDDFLRQAPNIRVQEPASGACKVLPMPRNLQPVEP